MNQGYQVLDPATLDTADVARQAFADAVLVGLSEQPKRLSSQWFYDDVGSDLFRQITALDVYYPTRLERGILTTHRAEIGAATGTGPIDVIDLGAGDGHKTLILLDHLLDAGRDVRYVPIDISEGAMRGLVERMGDERPDLRIAGLVSDYFSGLRWLRQQTGRTKLVLFLGSNIGNFDRPHACAFLQRLWNAMAPGDHLFAGFDLKKDIDKLLWAYNDPDGVTAAFNVNLLQRINNELGGHFDPKAFRHFATYNVFSGAMESYLVSRKAQRVAIDSLRSTFEFKPWEPIHTEYSYKYLESDVGELAEHGGFEEVARFYDPDRWFCDALLRVPKGSRPGG